jgi:hypothetical protein
MKRIRNLLLGTIAAFCLTSAASAASPVGTWSFDGNGYSGPLVINLDGGHNVTGSLIGDPIRGFWDDAAQKLVIYRVYKNTNVGTPPINIQVFTGYLFPANASQATGAQRLAGSFEAFSGTGGTATRNVFGWYATK